MLYMHAYAGKKRYGCVYVRESERGLRLCGDGVDCFIKGKIEIAAVDAGSAICETLNWLAGRAGGSETILIFELSWAHRASIST